LCVDKKEIVSIIKKRRKELGLNQTDFAKLIGLKTKQAISKIETGNLSVEKMLLIFDKLEIEMILKVKLHG
jgi:transcriptional regulator with XRE-family HTH domain